MHPESIIRTRRIASRQDLLLPIGRSGFFLRSGRQGDELLRYSAIKIWFAIYLI
jgi:hypothetical protein